MTISVAVYSSRHITYLVRGKSQAGCLKVLLPSIVRGLSRAVPQLGKLRGSVLFYFPSPRRDTMGLSYHKIYTPLKYLTFPERRGLAEQTVSSVRFGSEIYWKFLS